MQRAALSDVWLPKMRRAVQGELERQVREVAERVRDGRMMSWHDELRPVWAKRLVEAKRPLIVAMAIEGYRLAEVEFGKKAALLELLGAKAEIGAEFGSEAFIAGRLRPRLEEWLLKTALMESETSAKRLAAIQRRAAIKWDTPRAIAREILAQGLAQSKSRAETLARVSTIWTYNEGAKQLYRDEGVGSVGWVVTDDDALCEYCESLDGKEVPIDDSFAAAGDRIKGATDVEAFEGGTASVLEAPWDIEHPPLHPNCRCTIVPVL